MINYTSIDLFKKKLFLIKLLFLLFIIRFDVQAQSSYKEFELVDFFEYNELRMKPVSSVNFIRPLIGFPKFDSPRYNSKNVSKVKFFLNDYYLGETYFVYDPNLKTIIGVNITIYEDKIDKDLHIIQFSYIPKIPKKWNFKTFSKKLKKTVYYKSEEIDQKINIRIDYNRDLVNRKKCKDEFSFDFKEETSRNILVYNLCNLDIEYKEYKKRVIELDKLLKGENGE